MYARTRSEGVQDDSDQRSGTSMRSAWSLSELRFIVVWLKGVKRGRMLSVELCFAAADD
jgi:hypothetical protein